MNAFEQCLDVQPSFPQGLPAWRAIAFATQVAARARNGIPTLLNRHCFTRPMIQMSYDLYDLGRQHLACQLIGMLPGCRAQLHQAYRHGRQQSQQGTQSGVLLDLTLLNAATRFESLMEIFDHPAGTIPLHPLLGLLTRLGGNRGEQDPFQCFHPFGWLWLPDAYYPDQQRMPSFRLVRAWWQQTQRVPAERDPCASGFALLARREFYRRGGLCHPAFHHLKEMEGSRAGMLGMMRPGRNGRIHLFHQQIDTTVLSGTDGKVALLLATQTQERKDIAVPISHMHPTHAFRRRSQRLHASFPDLRFSLPLQALFFGLFERCWLAQKRFLVRDTKDLTGGGFDGQNGLQQKTLMSAIADGSQSARLRVVLVIDFGRILKQQDFLLLTALLLRGLQMWLDQCFVVDLRRVQKAVHGFQCRPIVQLFGQRSCGVRCQGAGKRDGTALSAWIAQLHRTKGSLCPQQW